MFELMVCPTSEGNPRNSEAAIVELSDGRLLLAWSDFYDADISDHAAARISGKTSADGGRTWNDPFVIQPNIGDINVMSASLLRLQSGELGLAFLRKDSMSDCRALMRRSSDDGRTWTEPVCCTPPERYHCVNNDRLVQLASGRILVPASHTDDVERNPHFLSCCYYSDDGGDTWRKGADVRLPGYGADEPAVVELRDGRVWMLIRTDLGHQYACHSGDGGVTWGNAEPLPLASPCSPASIKRIPETGDLLMVWNNARDVRVPLTVAISRDEGASWEHIKDIETEPVSRPGVPWDGYAYASILCHQDRVVLSYYVAGPGERWSLKLRSFPVAWLYE